MTKGVVMTDEAELGVYIALDRSGSMRSMWEEAIGSLNAFITKLKEEETDKDFLTLTTFDDSSIDTILDSVKLSTVKNITKDVSSPRGCTPLFDAAGGIINLALEKNRKKSVIIVVTDGQENASREYDKTTLSKKIKDAEEKGWEVVFLGANFDAMADARGVGLGANKVMNTNVKNFADTMAMAAGTVRGYSKGLVAGFNYSDEDRKKATEN